MIIIRDVFQAQYGKGGDLVNLLKHAQNQWSGVYAHRILTDLSGAFFTVVTETEAESLGNGNGASLMSLASRVSEMVCQHDARLHTGGTRRSLYPRWR